MEIACKLLTVVNTLHIISYFLRQSAETEA